MLTVNRSEGSRSNTLVLERNTVELTERELASKAIDELLTYEQYSVEEEHGAREEKIADLIKDIDGVSLANDDLTPTVETMKFQGKDNAEEFYNNSIEEGAFSFKLNKRGKMLIAVYSIAVALILALIVLNTGVINAIQLRLDEKAEKVASLETEYAQILEEVDVVTSDEYVIDRAVNEFNMSK